MTKAFLSLKQAMPTLPLFWMFSSWWMTGSWLYRLSYTQVCNCRSSDWNSSSVLLMNHRLREDCYWTVLHSPDLLLVAGPVLPQLQAGDGDQVVLATPLLLLLGTELNLESEECE